MKVHPNIFFSIIVLTLHLFRFIAIIALALCIDPLSRLLILDDLRRDTITVMPSVNQLSDIIIPMVDETAYSNRKLRVVTIGAGFSGLVLAHKLQHEQPDLQEFVDHTIFELQDDVGGTWAVNTYPGVQCDVPAHIYVSMCLKTSSSYD